MVRSSFGCAARILQLSSFFTPWLLLFLLGSPLIQAAPTPEQDALFRRLDNAIARPVPVLLAPAQSDLPPVPTTAQIRAVIAHDHDFLHKPTVFYTGQNNFFLANEWAKSQYGLYGYIIWTDMTSGSIRNDAWPDAQKAIWAKRLSKAMAELAGAPDGVVQVVYRDKTAPEPQSHWLNWELPVLTRSPLCKKIVIHYLPSGETETLWSAHIPPMGVLPPDV